MSDFRILLPLVIAMTAIGGALVSAQMTAVPAAASERCVRTKTLASIKYIDRDTVAAVMRDGTTFTNKLRTSCDIHRFEGFGYRSYNGYLCKGDRIRALRSGEACTLGSFEKTG